MIKKMPVTTGEMGRDDITISSEIDLGPYGGKKIESGSSMTTGRIPGIPCYYERISEDIDKKAKIFLAYASKQQYLTHKDYTMGRQKVTHRIFNPEAAQKMMMSANMGF